MPPPSEVNTGSTASESDFEVLRRRNKELEGALQERTAELAAMKAALQRTAAALSEREEHLRLALAGANAGMWLWDLQAEWQVTPQINVLFGHPSEAPPLGYGEFAALIHPDDRERVRRAWNQATVTGEPYEQEYRVLWPDGSLHWILSRGSRLDLPSGARQFLGVSLDITQSKIAGATLEHYGKLFRYASDLMVVAGADGFLRELNPAFARTLGYTEAELKAKPFLEFIHPEDRQGTLQELSRQRQGQFATCNFENRYLCKDGSLRLLSWNAYYEETEELFYGIARDITEQKAAAAALRESEEKFRVLSEAMPQMVWASDQTGRAYYFNSRWFAYTGQTFAQACNLGWLHTLHPDDVARAQERWTQAVTTGEPYEVEYRIRGMDGDYRWFLSRGIARRDSSAEVELWIGTCTDISAQKALEETLQRAREAAEAATRVKSDFLANISHEIRTPVTVFSTALELLQCFDFPPEQQELLDMADVSAARLCDLIEDILDLSRIEAHKMKVDATPFDLRRCVQEAVDLFILPAREKRLALTLEIAPEIPEKMIGDPGRLGQVIVNLVGNAVKFTDAGRVRVRVELRGEALEFSVADSGIGIPEEKIPLLFQSFSQVDTSLNRRYEGSGLGLAISKGLVEIMGGEISVQSREGEGSVFRFSVPGTRSILAGFDRV